MEETSKSENCPNCGREIPEEAPAGLCPQCLLEETARPTEPGGSPSNFAGFEPPEVDAVAAAFPHLEILESIGSGGMGAVFRARQPHLDREVALKILPPALAERPGFLERFTREGRLLAKLGHPNIVAVHDFGESGGFCYLLMEYVDGVNLRQAMRAERFTPEQALEVVPKICEALQFAHEEGILHRDIKPENILLDAKGRVKIADFGIAKLIGEAEGPSLTRSAVPGTPQYMAPEQIEQPDRVDHRADIFSLGVVFYEMLTGELPMGRFPAPSERVRVGGEVDAIVLRSLEKDRDRRQQSADEVRTQISEVPSGASQPSPPVPPPPTSEPPAGLRPNWPLGYALAGAVLVFAALSIAAVLKWAEETSWGVRGTVLTSIESDLGRMISQNEKEIRSAENGDGTNRAGVERRREILPLLESGRTIANRSRAHPARAVLPGAFFPYWIHAGLVAIVSTGLCTTSAWRQLKLLRGEGSKAGRIRLMIGALLFPCLAASGVFFLIILLPLWMMGASRGFAGVGISVGITSSLILAAYLTFLTLKWLRRPTVQGSADQGKSSSSHPTSQRFPQRFVVAGLGLGIVVLGTGMALVEPPHRGWLWAFFGPGALGLFLLMVRFEFSDREEGRRSLMQGASLFVLLLGLLVGTFFLLIQSDTTRKKEVWETFRGDWGIGVQTDWGNLPKSERVDPEVRLRVRKNVPGIFRLTVALESEDSSELEEIAPAAAGTPTSIGMNEKVVFTLSAQEEQTPVFRFRFPESFEHHHDSEEGPEFAEKIWHKAFRLRFPKPFFLEESPVFPLFALSGRKNQPDHRAWVRVEFIPTDSPS